jgi:hypothetical protein
MDNLFFLFSFFSLPFSYPFFPFASFSNTASFSTPTPPWDFLHRSSSVHGQTSPGLVARRARFSVRAANCSSPVLAASTTLSILRRPGSPLPKVHRRAHAASMPALGRGGSGSWARLRYALAADTLCAPLVVLNVADRKKKEESTD